MYCMLSCFNLKPDVSREDFVAAREQFFRHLRDIDLIEGIGPLCERDRETPMDTEDRSHQYYYLSYFANKKQCDRSYQYILENQGIRHPIHQLVHSKTSDEVFVCFAELPA